jgi:hypothetical protein
MKFILITLISAVATYSQIFNSDFENWTDVKDHMYQPDFEEYEILNAKSGNLNGWNEDWAETGIAISNESVSGEHSLIIHNWYNYATGMASYSTKITEIPIKLTGYYKFYEEEAFRDFDDSRASIAITFYDSFGDTVSHQIEYFTNQEEFTKFEIPITFIGDEEKVDSISFVFRNAVNLMCDDWDNICNLFFIDALDLKFNPNSVDDDSPAINIYPNPTSDIITINGISSSIQIEIIDRLGNIVMKGTNNKFDVSKLPIGQYFIKINSSGSEQYLKFVKM